MPLLSEKAVDALVYVAGYVGDDAGRAAAREAVDAAAQELNIDPLKPPLPKFSAGEDVISTAVLSVLKVPGVDKELGRSRDRADACRAAAKRIAELKDRAKQLQRVELDRIRDQVMAGKTPGPAPAGAVAEYVKLAGELALVGETNVAAIVRTSDLRILLDAAKRPDVIASTVFYGQLVTERLRMLTADESYQSRSARTAKSSQQTVLNLVKDGGGTVRKVRAAVEVADLHRLAERHEPTVEELELMAARPRAERAPV